MIIINRVLHHSVSLRPGGSSAGYRNNLVLFPDDDLAVIILSNNIINELVKGIPYYIADDIFNLPKTRDWLFGNVVRDTQMVYKRYGKEDPAVMEAGLPPQLKAKPVTRDLADFAGEYTHPVAGNITFKLVRTMNRTEGHRNDKKEEEDVLAFEAFGFKGILDHYHFDSFRLHAKGDRKFFTVLATFVTGADGSVQKCCLSSSGGESNVFTKVKTDTKSPSIIKEE